MKRLFIVAALAGIGFLSPVQAQEMAKCDDATMMKVEKDVMGMTDPAMKDKMEMGMKELEMAKMAMKDNKEKDCSMHLDAAMKASMGQ